MKNKKILVSLATFAVFFTSVAPIIASAQSVTAAAGVSATVGSSVSATVTAKASTRLTKIVSTSDTAITARLTALANLNTRVQTLKNVSATVKTSISNQVQTNVTGLTALKAKIDADTDVTVATADAKTITGSFRIYALVIPQGYIAASSDRVDTIVAMMTTISTKLQTRITADQAAGKNVASLQASLTDITAKLTDATTQATTAQNGIQYLVPDQGNVTQLQANTTALKAARANIKIATADLQAARTDAKGIIQGLKSFEAEVSATASTTVQ